MRWQCPRCTGEVTPARDGYTCVEGHSFPVRDGVPDFLGQDDAFYEGRFVGVRDYGAPDEVARLPGGRLLWEVYRRISVSERRQRRFRRWLDGFRGEVLDLGCGSGTRFFASLGPTVGVDVSQASLREARGLYAATARADALSLPFADESFDAVVSADLVGHIPVVDKPRLIAEIRRVLRPGGRTFHVVECDSNNWIFQHGKRRPELFHRYFVEEIGGHFGLEPGPVAASRFRQADFSPLVEEGLYDLLWNVKDYVRVFDNDYRLEDGVVSLVAAVARRLAQRPATLFLANTLLGVASRAAESRSLSRRSVVAFLGYEKPG
jgi:SAM-dependent methyltransferase